MLSEPKIDLGSTPLANEFLKDQEPQDMFPLQVCVCETCGHYQLNESVSPERLFRHYLYVAGTSPVNVEHFRKYAADMIQTFELKPNSKILDIASNDGTLLQAFKDLNMSVLGIDPAVNLATEATDKGIETIPEFFTEEQADKMLTKYGRFDLITANNVFAHVSEMIDFAKGVKKLMAPNGIFSFEVSYFTDVCDHTLFDTIYHEHSSYHTIKPLHAFFNTYGLKVFDVWKLDNHGGSVRVFVCNKDSKHDVLTTLRATSLGYFNFQEREIEQKVTKLKREIKYLGLELREELRLLKQQDKSIAIYGVPAKATTLMYALGIDETLIDFAVDDAILKQGTFTPGKKIPVLATNTIYERKPDVLLVLAWNFADSIMKKHSEFKGTWIVPVPEFKVINVSVPTS
jgi:SAM-dependent methyltransferase